MKKAIQCIVVGLLITALIYIIFLLNFKKESISVGKVLINKSELDSMKNVSARIDTVTKDSIVYLDKIVFKDHSIPYPAYNRGNIAFYSDSLINDTINLIINDTIEGKLRNRVIQYRPRERVKTIEVTKYIPKVVTVQNEIEVKRAMLYGGLEIGGNRDTFIPGVEVGVITKSNNIYSLQYQTNFSKSFFSVGIKKIITFRK